MSLGPRKFELKFERQINSHFRVGGAVLEKENSLKKKNMEICVVFLFFCRVSRAYEEFMILIADEAEIFAKNSANDLQNIENGMEMIVVDQSSSTLGGSVNGNLSKKHVDQPKLPPSSSNRTTGQLNSATLPPPSSSTGLKMKVKDVCDQSTSTHESVDDAHHLSKECAGMLLPAGPNVTPDPIFSSPPILRQVFKKRCPIQLLHSNITDTQSSPFTLEQRQKISR